MTSPLSESNTDQPDQAAWDARRSQVELAIQAARRDIRRQRLQQGIASPPPVDARPFGPDYP